MSLQEEDRDADAEGDRVKMEAEGCGLKPQNAWGPLELDGMGRILSWSLGRSTALPAP